MDDEEYEACIERYKTSMLKGFHETEGDTRVNAAAFAQCCFELGIRTIALSGDRHFAYEMLINLISIMPEHLHNHLAALEGKKIPNAERAAP